MRDKNNLQLSLEELNLSNVRAALVALVVQLSLERKPSHREMCSVLLSDCYDRCVELTKSFRKEVNISEGAAPVN